MKQIKVVYVFALLASFLVSSAAMALEGATKADSSSKYSDAEIASIVVAANTVDIDAGKFAQKHASNSKVQQFAKKMETDHTSVNKQAVDLVTKLKVQPKENDLSRKLTSDGEKTREHLSTLSGAAFDKAYIDNEVAYHEAVIDVVKTKLIPDASNAELKNLLVKVSPAFVEHLNHAKSLQAELDKAA